jgi:hypothetical protein
VVRFNRKTSKLADEWRNLISLWRDDDDKTADECSDELEGILDRFEPFSDAEEDDESG